MFFYELTTKTIVDDNFFMRSALSIAYEVKGALPDEYQDRIDSIIESIKFAAPEMMGIHAQRINDFVNNITNYPPKEEWEFKVIAALMDISVEELKNSVLKDVHTSF